MFTPRFSKTTPLALALTLLLCVSAPCQEAPPDLVLDRKVAELEKLKAAFKADAKTPEVTRKLAQAMSDLATYYSQRGQKGDLDRAFTYFTSTLELRELILKTTNGEPSVARTISASLNELAALLVQRGQSGDFEKALEHVTRGLEIAESLRKKHPDAPDFARDAAVSLDRLGSLLVRRAGGGDGDKALEYFTRALEITDAAHKLKPDSSDTERDLALSLERMASIIHARGDGNDEAKIVSHLTRSVELRESVSKKKPESTSASHELSVSLEKLADFLFERGNPSDTEKIKAHYGKCLAIREGLLKAMPNNGNAARALCVGLNKLADFLATIGNDEDVPTILRHFTRDLDISEKLLAANPTSAESARDVVVSRYKLGKFTESIGKPEDSEKHFRACFELLKNCTAGKMTFDAPTMKLLEDLKTHFDEK